MAMLLASINYTLSLGFALTFLIGSVAWISIHHAFRNLVGLSINAGPQAEAVFCGTPARFGVVTAQPGTAPPAQGLKIWRQVAVQRPSSDAEPFDYGPLQPPPPRTSTWPPTSAAGSQLPR
jgi:hypothetical protein